MMRCLTIAKELVRRGDSVTFFLADEESKGLFDAYVGTGAEGGEIGAVVLGTNWQDMEAEIPALVKVFQRFLPLPGISGSKPYYVPGHAY